MQGCHRWAMCVSLALLVASTTSAAGPAASSMAGSWSCSLSHVRVSGICPPTPRQSGTCEIRETGGVVTLVYVTGFRCRPKAACSFSCTESGEDLTCQNSGSADGGGGQYATTLVLNPSSAGKASGTGKSTYSGPGMRCEWKTSLAFTRPPTSDEKR